MENFNMAFADDLITLVTYFNNGTCTCFMRWIKAKLFFYINRFGMARASCKVINMPRRRIFSTVLSILYKLDFALVLYDFMLYYSKNFFNQDIKVLLEVADTNDFKQNWKWQKRAKITFRTSWRNFDGKFPNTTFRSKTMTDFFGNLLFGNSMSNCFWNL